MKPTSILTSKERSSKELYKMKDFIDRRSHNKQVILREADIAIRLGIKLLLGHMGLAHVTMFWVCCLCFNRMNMQWYVSMIIASYRVFSLP